MPLSYLKLEHRLLNVFKKEGLPQEFLVAVSGGKDSMALLKALVSLKKQLRLNLKVVHVHHGPSHDVETSQFRDRAWKLVSESCGTFSLPFVSNTTHLSDQGHWPDQPLVSEDQLRQYREGWFRRWLNENPNFFVALGHHQQDVLESRLIQMIRGCGERGFQSLSLRGARRLRPLISFSKSEINRYIALTQVKFIEDPSNSSNLYLRNWIRNFWLPGLESFRPGSTSVLAQSFDNLSASLNSEVDERGHLSKEENVYNAERRCLNLVGFLAISAPNKYKYLIKFLSEHNLRGFGKTHLDEFLKRLDIGAKEHTFTLLKKNWVIRDNELYLQPLNDTKKA